MASSHVIVLDAALKRTQVKVTPGKYMREVLEEACKARKVDPEAYALKTQNNKPVDLSQPFRLSGLAAGAKLQLVQGSRSPTVVNVALQLPESEGGGKLIDKFASTNSLWQVLRKFEDAVAGEPPRKLNLTQRATPVNVGSGSGRLEYEQPCLNIMGRNLEAFADLQKQLSQLGLSGSVMMRLSFKSSGQPLDVAMSEIEQYFKAVTPSATSTSSAVAPADDTGLQTTARDTAASSSDLAAEKLSEPVVSTSLDNTVSTDAEMAEVSTNDAVSSTQAELEVPQPQQSSNVLNGISVYRPPTSNTPAAALQEDDPAIYEPGIEHAKAHQAALVRAGRNTRLLSDAEIAEQDAARQAQLATVRTVKVRVRYPDQSIIETTVTASDTPVDLYAKVTDTLAHAPEPFELRFAGPKGPHQILPAASSQRLVQDFGFRGSILLTLVWAAEASLQARQGPSLKDEYRVRATELKVELQSQREASQQNHKAAMAKPDNGATSSNRPKGDLEAKMKKFLGFGKK